MIYQPASPLVTYIMALVFVGVAVVAYFVYRRKARALSKVSAEIVERRPEQLMKVLWNPMHHELSQIIAAEGVVTDPRSEWARIGALAKSETGARFLHGMDEYLRRRRRIVDMSAGL